MVTHHIIESQELLIITSAKAGTGDNKLIEIKGKIKKKNKTRWTI
jgi:hypothetical protein